MKLVALKTLNISDQIATDEGHRVREVAIGEEFHVLDAEAKPYITRGLAEKVKDAPAAKPAPAPSAKK